MSFIATGVPGYARVVVTAAAAEHLRGGERVILPRLLAIFAGHDELPADLRAEIDADGVLYVGLADREAA